MNILAIDTSSTSGSVAVAVNGRITYLSFLDIAVTHSERLMPQIDNALKQSKIKIADIDIVALGNGPGSFTGIRIGLATAKGICFGLKIPLLAYNTLDILYKNMDFCQQPVAALIDARMNEIYGALYDEKGHYLIEPCNDKPESFLDKITTPTIFVGDGSIKFRNLIISNNQEHQIAHIHQNIPLASIIISMVMSEKNLPDYDFETISKLEPFYLRKSQAELAKLEQSNK